MKASMLCGSAGVLVLIASLAVAGDECRKDSTRKCCSVVSGGPQSGPACASEPFSSNCNDLILGIDHTIQWVESVAAGLKAQSDPLTPQTCKWQVRDCNAQGYCAALGNLEQSCWPTALGEPRQACPPE